MIGIATGALVLVALGYWLLITTEGTYLGTRIVTLLYDWMATKYDDIKALEYVNEQHYIGIPLSRTLKPINRPRVLDVATGTGRLLLAVKEQLDDDALVVGVDRSHRMLAAAQVGPLVQGDARHLSFCDGGFDCVCCLEAIEFMAVPVEVLQEMLRVLGAGGLLLLSNRVGHDAWFFPGRMCGRGRLERRLAEMGCTQIRTERWQVHYDLVWARGPVADNRCSACSGMSPGQVASAPRPGQHLKDGRDENGFHQSG